MAFFLFEKNYVLHEIAAGYIYSCYGEENCDVLFFIHQNVPKILRNHGGSKDDIKNVFGRIREDENEANVDASLL